VNGVEKVAYYYADLEAGDNKKSAIIKTMEKNSRLIAVYDAKEYRIINLKNGEKHMRRGKEVILSMNQKETIESLQNEKVQPDWHMEKKGR